MELMALRKPERKAALPTKNLVAVDGTLDHVYRLRLSILERGRSADPMELRILRHDAVRERIECHNPLCEGGGFSLGDLLRDLVHGRQSEFIGTSFCTGQEQVHPEVEEFRSCRTRFEVEAHIEFRG
jgi:hypothetical protein